MSFTVKLHFAGDQNFLPGDWKKIFIGHLAPGWKSLFRTLSAGKSLVEIGEVYTRKILKSKCAVSEQEILLEKGEQNTLHIYYSENWTEANSW